MEILKRMVMVILIRMVMMTEGRDKYLYKEGDDD